MLSPEVARALAEDFAGLALLHDAELDATLIAGLRQAGFPGSMSVLPCDDLARVGISAMASALAMLPAVPDAACLDELAADYAAIYLTAAYGASPSESYWLSDDHLVCQDAMFELRELYRTHGLVAPDWRRRPDDHLVYQLQFLARRLESVAGDDDWRALAGFLDFHLLRWLPDFSRRVSERCDTAFYGALMLLTDAWCRQLRELIANHLGEARPTAEEIAATLASRRVVQVEAVPLQYFPGGAGPSW
jgi:TorA maturation chaperone TorD